MKRQDPNELLKSCRVGCSCYCCWWVFFPPRDLYFWSSYVYLFKAQVACALHPTLSRPVPSYIHTLTTGRDYQPVLSNCKHKQTVSRIKFHLNINLKYIFKKKIIINYNNVHTNTTLIYFHCIQDTFSNKTDKIPNVLFLLSVFDTSWLLKIQKGSFQMTVNIYIIH